jgi:hypothetical protein
LQARQEIRYASEVGVEDDTYDILVRLLAGGSLGCGSDRRENNDCQHDRRPLQKSLGHDESLLVSQPPILAQVAKDLQKFRFKTHSTLLFPLKDLGQELSDI